MRSVTSNFKRKDRADAFLQRFGEPKASLHSSRNRLKRFGPGIRKRMLRKFRYSLLYSIEKDSLLILLECVLNFPHGATVPRYGYRFRGGQVPLDRPPPFTHDEVRNDFNH